MRRFVLVGEIPRDAGRSHRISNRELNSKQCGILQTYNSFFDKHGRTGSLFVHHVALLQGFEHVLAVRKGGILVHCRRFAFPEAVARGSVSSFFRPTSLKFVGRNTIRHTIPPWLRLGDEPGERTSTNVEEDYNNRHFDCMIQANLHASHGCVPRPESRPSWLISIADSSFLLIS